MSLLRDVLKEHGSSVLTEVPERTLESIGITDEALHTLLYTPAHSIKHPLFHREVEPRSFLPIPEQYVPYLQCMLLVRYSDIYSYREAREKLTEAGYKVSGNGQLVNIFDRMETKLNLKDKRRNLEVRAAERKGRPPRKRTNKQKAALVKARKTHEANAAKDRKIKERAKERKALAKQAVKDKLTGKELRDNIKQARGIQTSSVIVTPENVNVLYKPHPKQLEFHEAGEKIVLYGGAAGGGKSYAMLMDALPNCIHGDYRALIIRKTSPMLKELIGVSRSLYPKAFPGARYNKQESVWYFPGGATIEFGYLDKPEDLERYQGLPYAYIGFDEIQHQRSPEGFLYLMSRLRSANPEITCYMRASANPGGAAWVKEYFIDPAAPGTTFWKDGLSYKFIPARLEDNPSLDTPEAGSDTSAYRKMLMALPEVQRKQLLNGDWLVGDDNAFAFIPEIHVTTEDPPLHWNQIRSMDYGYRDPASTIWSAVSPDNTIVVYDEHEITQTPAVVWAQEILNYERRNQGGFGIAAPLEEVIDWSVFRNTGQTGPGILEQVHKLGMRPRPADRSREAGWNQIHNRLLLDEEGIPSLVIHERCEKLIDQLASAKIHPKKPDDIDDTRPMSKGRKHHWDLLDTLRYTCMARPSTMSYQDRALKYKTMGDPLADTWSKFGR